MSAELKTSEKGPHCVARKAYLCVLGSRDERLHGGLPSVSTEATELLTSPCRRSRVAEACTHFPVSQRTLVTANDQNCLICPALITPLSPN